MSNENKAQYLDNVKKDFQELRSVYPFSTLIILPTAEITEAQVKVVAANKGLIEELLAEQSDFTGEYTRELKIVIPFDYKDAGCNVYGGAWIDLSKIRDADKHFHKKVDDGLQFCVGVPGSFVKLSNVLLENVKTAENMLIAYEEIQRGKNHRLNLNAYSHGDRGKNEYEHDRTKYVS